jgi:hypothetical protein
MMPAGKNAEWVMRAWMLLVALVAWTGTAAGASDELDLGLNGDALRASYAHTFNNPGLRFDAGWLYHQDVGDVIHAGLLVVGEAGSKGVGLDAGIGARIVFIDGEGGSREGYGLAPGFQLTWNLPRLNRVSITGEAYYAPDILVGGDAEEYIDLMARAAYAVTRQARVYLGVRYVGTDYGSGDEPLFDTGMHAGLNVSF